MKMSRLELLSEFGFRKEPFRGVSIETEDMRRLSNVLAMAVDGHAMISVIGERGSGKSCAVQRVLSARGCRVVHISAADKESLKIGDIEAALIYGLSEESPKHRRILRGYQVAKILKIASLKDEVVLLIEEAHRIHGQTLRSLKTLREPDDGGEPRFTTVFIGQYDFLAAKRGLDEVRLRSDALALNGLTAKEATEYITLTVGRIFDAGALELLARTESARNFLDLQAAALAAMEQAYLDGRRQVTVEDVNTLFGAPEAVNAEKKNGDEHLKKLLNISKGKAKHEVA